MKRAALLLVLILAGAGCRPTNLLAGGEGPKPEPERRSPGVQGGGIDAWYLFTGEPAPFEGYLIHPEDLERILKWAGAE